MHSLATLSINDGNDKMIVLPIPRPIDDVYLLLQTKSFSWDFLLFEVPSLKSPQPFYHWHIVPLIRDSLAQPKRGLFQ